MQYAAEYVVQLCVTAEHDPVHVIIQINYQINSLHTQEVDEAEMSIRHVYVYVYTLMTQNTESQTHAI